MFEITHLNVHASGTHYKTRSGLPVNVWVIRQLRTFCSKIKNKFRVPFKSNRFCDGSILQTWLFNWQQRDTRTNGHSFDSTNLRKTQKHCVQFQNSDSCGQTEFTQTRKGQDCCLSEAKVFAEGPNEVSSENFDENSDKNFQKLVAKLSERKNMSEFIEREFGVVWLSLVVVGEGEFSWWLVVA